MAPRRVAQLIHSLIVLLAFLTPLFSARSLNQQPTLFETEREAGAQNSLVGRLRLNEDGSASSNSCWDSLFRLQSCTGDVILFFLNGETKLGPDCCKAVGLIEEYCWPNMIASLGFTAEEEQVLRGYCDKENASH
uniref:Prolamin-like domain-containing protein n=1 Tax=Kalanchoe fedtschenkoi TaxID=63787 RepID=A0A7N0TDD8_KALFE